MRKTYYLLFIFMYLSCNSNGENEEIISPNGILTENEKVEILNTKLKGLKIVTNFKIQSEELQNKLKSYNYDIFSNGNILDITSEETYGKYHKRINFNGNSVYPIESYSFKVLEKKITEKNEEPFIIQEFFYENNADFSTNKPFYQFQITFSKVNQNSYNLIKKWLNELDIVTGNFENVSDLKFVKERVTQSNIIVEIGEHDDNGINEVIFIRIFENKIPLYSQ